MSFRDRFFTRPVARAITSPSAILATGGGAALGILVGLGPIGAVLGGLAAFAIRVGIALPKATRSGRIDPFRLSDPWNRLTVDALSARDEFYDATRKSPVGPIADRLHTIGDQIDTTVDECWQIAQAGDQLSRARGRINLPQIQRELDEVNQLRSTAPDPTLDATATALQAQLATAQRMTATITDTQNRLRLLNARLDEAVTRSIELSVARADADALGSVGNTVSDILTEMEALRAAVVEVREVQGGTPAPGVS